MNRHLIIQIVFFMLAGAANAADQAHNQSAVSFTDVGSFSDFASADYGPQQGRAELQRSLQNVPATWPRNTCRRSTICTSNLSTSTWLVS